MTLAKFQGHRLTIPSLRGEQCYASFKQACQLFCLSMPHIDIPTISFHQPSKGTLAGLLPGSFWGEFLPALMVVSLRCFHVDAWQRWAPGTFRVDICAWGQGKIEVIWKLLCFLSLQACLQLFCTRASPGQNCEVSQAYFCHLHLPLVQSYILSVYNCLPFPSCQSLPRAQSSGWSEVTTIAASPVVEHPRSVPCVLVLSWGESGFRIKHFLYIHSLIPPLPSASIDLGWVSHMCTSKNLPR